MRKEKLEVNNGGDGDRSIEANPVAFVQNNNQAPIGDQQQIQAPVQESAVNPIDLPVRNSPAATVGGPSGFGGGGGGARAANLAPGVIEAARRRRRENPSLGLLRGLPQFNQNRRLV
ncbi:hypothetical protein PENTCL1PPCAC_3815, partial [Pristionchus entomophagus]